MDRRFRQLIQLTVALAAMVVASFEVQAVQAAKEYCTDGGISITRPDLKTEDVRARCRSIANFFRWKEIAPNNPQQCTICDPRNFRVATPPPPPPPPPLPPTRVNLPQLPPGIQILKGPIQDNSCRTNYPTWAFDAYRITISSTSGNCPSPYITNGYDSSFTPRRRVCAYCEGSTKGLKWGCCQR